MPSCLRAAGLAWALLAPVALLAPSAPASAAPAVRRTAEATPPKDPAGPAAVVTAGGLRFTPAGVRLARPAVDPRTAPAFASAPGPARVEGEPPPTLDGNWQELGPPPRLAAAMAYDTKRGRWLLFGGVPGWSHLGPLYSNETWALDPAHDRQWQRIDVPAGARPPGAAGHRLVYDSVHDRLLLFGGAQAVIGDAGVVRFDYYRDVWALPLDGPPAWTLLEATGGPATGRTLPAVAYDAAGDRLLVFGGYYADTDNHDPDYYGVSFGDLWEFSLATDRWRLLDDGATGPAPRSEALLAVDAAAERLLVIGGAVMEPDPVHGIRDVDRFDLWARPRDGSAGWSALDVGDTRPETRLDLSAAWDAAARRAWVTGGFWSDPDVRFDASDVWVLDAGAAAPRWTKLAPGGAVPTPRSDAACLFDARGGRFALVSGSDGGEALTDAWSIAAEAPAWRKEAPASDPGPGRQDAAAAFDEAGRRLVVYGGERQDPETPYFVDYLGDLRAYDLDLGTWSTLAALGPTPVPRAGAAAAYDRASRRMWLVGGVSRYGEAAREAWSLDLAATPRWHDWSNLPGAPGALEDACAVFDPVGRGVIVFGRERTGSTVGAWELSTDDPARWSALAPAGPTPPPHGRAAAYDARRHRMLLFGGYGGGSASAVADVYALGLDGAPAWTLLATAGDTPPPGIDATVAYDSTADRLLVFGGDTGTGYPGVTTSDVYELRFADGAPSTWRRLLLRGGPPVPRLGAVGAFDARRAAWVVLGGWDGFLFPCTDTWRLALARPVIEVALDARPGAASGVVGAGARAPLAVALLSSAGFDPARVDAASLALCGVPPLPGAPPAVGRATRDWNGDGVADRLAWFDGAAVRARALDGQLELTGALTDGTPIHGRGALDLRGRAPAAANALPTAPASTALLGLSRGGGGAASALALRFAVARAGRWTVALYDVRGRRVAGGEGEAAAAGPVRARLEARGALAPGVYFARLALGGETVTGRLALTGL